MKEIKQRRKCCDQYNNCLIKDGDEVENDDARFYAKRAPGYLVLIDIDKPWTLKNDKSPFAQCIKQGNYAANYETLFFVQEIKQELPPGLPPLPPNTQILGLGGTFDSAGKRITYAWHAKNPRWIKGRYDGDQKDMYYAIEAIPATPSVGDGVGSADVIDRPKDLRDEFAIEAMKSFLRSGGVHIADEGEAREDAMIYAQASYLYADAMLIFRDRESALADALIAADKRKD